MSITPVAFSLMASFMSAITLLGVSSENYTYGFQFIIINLSYGLFTPVAAYLYLPVFFKLQATSAYEVSEILVMIDFDRGFVVLGTSFWKSGQTSRVLVLHLADDVVHGNCGVRSCFGFGGFDWYYQRNCNIINW